MMVKRKLDSAVDESTADQEICKPHTTVHNLWKIWKPPPSETRSYGKLAQQSSRQNLGEAWNFKSLL